MQSIINIEIGYLEFKSFSYCINETNLEESVLLTCTYVIHFTNSSLFKNSNSTSISWIVAMAVLDRGIRDEKWHAENSYVPLSNKTFKWKNTWNRL